MSFGQRVKLRRRQLGLTQKELAKLIGISRSAVNSWEIGDHTPGGDSAVKLPVYLQCSWDWLVTGKGDVSDKTPDVTKELLVPLIDKSFIVSFIEGTYSPEEYAGDNSAKMRDIFGASKDTFAFIEVSDGMEPRICSGDTVYVDPSQKECEPSGVY